MQSARAQSSRLYFSGYMGLSLSKDMAFNDSTSSTSGELGNKNGTALAGALGLRLTRFSRLEAELSYSQQDFSSLSISGGSAYNIGGQLESWRTMLNYYYDFKVPWKVQPFVGAGVGMVWYDGRIDSVAGVSSDATGNDFALAWQVGGGVKYRVNDSTAFTGSYRYLDSSNVNIRGYQIDYGAHEFRLGLEYDIPVK